MPAGLPGVRTSAWRPQPNDTAAHRGNPPGPAAFPDCAIRIVPVTTVMPNGKAGALSTLPQRRSIPIMVINDADICVEPDYLQVTEPLANPGSGWSLRSTAPPLLPFPARFEALGVATEFAPSVLVARLLGVAEFALGSTMAVRASDLRRIGGFRAIGDYLADDYQLGAQITRLGLHVEFADTVVETTLGAGSWEEVWTHQVRWSQDHPGLTAFGLLRLCRDTGHLLGLSCGGGRILAIRRRRTRLARCRGGIFGRGSPQGSRRVRHAGG